MKVTTTTLWLPKRGNTEEEYEDAAAPVDPVDSTFDTFRCAVADGATETSFSGLWAKLLVDGFVAGEDRNKLKEKWHQQIDGKQLAWYAAEKAQSGAFAALVCLTVSESESDGRKWRAEAIGDSCLMLLRGKTFLERFPLRSAGQFNSSPLLLSTNQTAEEASAESFCSVNGEWQSGDIFYLMSDALAHWVYQREEEHGDAAAYLESMKKQSDLEEFTKVQRELIDAESRPLMRNDDVTLLRVVLT